MPTGKYRHCGPEYYLHFQSQTFQGKWILFIGIEESSILKTFTYREVHGRYTHVYNPGEIRTIVILKSQKYKSQDLKSEIISVYRFHFFSDNTTY